MSDQEPKIIGWRVGPGAKIDDLIEAPTAAPSTRSGGISRRQFLLGLAGAGALAYLTYDGNTVLSGATNTDTPGDAGTISLAGEDGTKRILMPTPTLREGGFICITTDPRKPDTSKSCANSDGDIYFQEEALTNGETGAVSASALLPSATSIPENQFRRMFPDVHAIVGSLGSSADKYGNRKLVKPEPHNP